MRVAVAVIMRANGSKVCDRATVLSCGQMGGGTCSLARLLAWSLGFLVARRVDDWFDRSTPLIWIACTWTGRYEGEWLDDAQHGQGVTSTAQGEVGQQFIGCTQRAAPDTVSSGLIEAPLQYPRKHPREFASPPANSCAAVFVFKQPTACWG